MSPEARGGFTLSGSRALGCLLVHGLTATAEEMRPLGEALAARGFPVHAVCLAGHGTDLASLARARWVDWFASVSEGLARLRPEAPRIAIAGMSLGRVGGRARPLRHAHPAERRTVSLAAHPGAASVRRAPLCHHSQGERKARHRRPRDARREPELPGRAPPGRARAPPPAGSGAPGATERDAARAQKEADEAAAVAAERRRKADETAASLAELTE